MNNKAVALIACFVAAAMSGCSAPTVSGTYLETEDKAAVLLQLTQASDGHVSGTMSFSLLANDGSVSSMNGNITGTTDGKAITLTLQPQQLQFLGGTMNLSGQVIDGGLTLTMPSGNTVVSTSFKRSSIEAFQQASAALSVRGQAIKGIAERNNQIAHLDEATNALRNELLGFIDWSRSYRGIKAFKDQFDGVLNTARRDLAELHRDEAIGSGYAHGQAQYQQGQITYQEGQLEYLESTLAGAIKDARARIARLDAALSQSLCFSRTVKPGDAIPNMGPCRELDRVASDYRVAEANTVSVEAQEQAIVASTDAAMSEIKKDAGTTLAGHQ